MDFITHLPPSNGKTTIWVIVDRLTKFAHFISLPAHYSSASLATIFLQQIYRLHGLPKSILSDRDPLFVSNFWKDLFATLGTTLLHSSAYHPQTDGQTEVVNRGLESYLRCFTCDEPTLWNRYLYLAEFWYNTSFNSAINTTPFQALYGRPPPALPQYTLGKSKDASIDDNLLEHDRIIRLLKETLRKTRQQMADQANKHRTDKEFQVGEWVLLKLQPYRQTTVSNRQSQKLSRRYFGPFQIKEKIGKVAYRLRLPEEVRIHPVFHVSLLRAAKGDWTSTITTLPAELGDLLNRNISADLEDKFHFEGRDTDTSQPQDHAAKRPTRNRKMPSRYLE